MSGGGRGCRLLAVQLVVARGLFNFPAFTHSFSSVELPSLDSQYESREGFPLESRSYMNSAVAFKRKESMVYSEPF
jgi:hypothetical protein